MPFINSVRGSFGPQGKTKHKTGRLGVDSTGGIITESGGYRIHRFTGVGTSTFFADSAGTVEYLIVAGGGGGGSQVGGGGGAGGYRTGTLSVSGSTNYSIVVGAGGVGGRNYAASLQEPGDYGQNSSAFGVTSTRGGGGGTHPEARRPVSGDDGILGGNGRPGGSGGGGGGTDASRNAPGGSGTSGQGSNGGSGQVGWFGGGGGGAGSNGSNATTSSGGTNGATGGSGISNSISGSATFYAAGGGGCNSDNNLYTTTRSSGVGGRGTGFVNPVNNDAYPEKNAVENSGSGGGGHRDGALAGNGGSGIVIIRYIPS